MFALIITFIPNISLVSLHLAIFLSIQCSELKFQVETPIWSIFKPFYIMNFSNSAEKLIRKKEIQQHEQLGIYQFSK